MVQLDSRLSTAMNAKIMGCGEKTLILAHGFGGDQSVWDLILPQLLKNFKILVFDWIFSGAITSPNLFDSHKYSSYEAFATDLISLLDEFNLQNSIFIGHSMSGMVGCIAAIKKPELFQRLVLLGASPRYLNSEDYEGGFDKPALEKIFSGIEFDFQSWALSFASMGVGVDDSVSVEKFGKCLLSMKPETALSMAKTIFLSDYRDILEKVEVPCTIIQTEKDVAVPRSAAQYMQNNLGGKPSLKIIPVEGHLPQLTAPKLLTDVLIESCALNLSPRPDIFLTSLVDNLRL